ncbi:hypothetical protein ACIRSS_08945 [Amycolatopsis sp. NPDC101161]|uniref:hypothetical protein n=1 Tax=Amycolatopsis sp. NPDC101161 TaxID=3363940 RepID=UPI003828F841
MKLHDSTRRPLVGEATALPRQTGRDGRMASVRSPRPWESLGCGKGATARVSWPANTLSVLEIRVKSYNVGLAEVTYEI